MKRRLKTGSVAAALATVIGMGSAAAVATVIGIAMGAGRPPRG
jgi:Na+-driven multidrug efflux pump